MNELTGPGSDGQRLTSCVSGSAAVGQPAISSTALSEIFAMSHPSRIQRELKMQPQTAEVQSRRRIEFVGSSWRRSGSQLGARVRSAALRSTADLNGRPPVRPLAHSGCTGGAEPRWMDPLVALPSTRPLPATPQTDERRQQRRDERSDGGGVAAEPVPSV